MRLVLISDTHGHHAHVKMPPGDVLIHAGDFSRDGGQADVRGFLSWMELQPYAHKILICGNHDPFEKYVAQATAMMREVAPSVTYLQDSGVVINGIRFWGSPMTPTFFDWHFNRDRGPAIKRHWDMIPDDTDVLVTHGPARDILDKTMDDAHELIHEGCDDLFDALERVKPLVHVFGHFHGAYGATELNYVDGSRTHCYNAAICDERYKPVRKAHEHVLEIPPR